MTTHVLRVAAFAAFVLLVTLLPFLPGHHDPLARPLSAMARVAGGVGLLLVPVGLAWLLARRGGTNQGRERGFEIATLVVAAGVWLAASLAALGFGGVSLGVAAVVLGVACGVRAASRQRGRALPAYLAVVPVVVFALQSAVVGWAVERSRNRAIRNAAPLIAEIERHREVFGRYPESLVALWPDFLPLVAGIERYVYEPSGEAYNLAFEQPALELSANEIVVYNPLDEQAMTSHAADRLRFGPEVFAIRRGWFAVHEASVPHWKYYLFD